MLPLILASGSAIRATLLANAGIAAELMPARLDEQALIASLVAEDATPHDIADALAEYKAHRIAARHPERLVLGCDQLLVCEGRIFNKPDTPEQAIEHLQALRGKTHKLHTAAVLFFQARPVWRHVATPHLTMRNVSDAWLDDYVRRNWNSIRHCVGCYQIEGEGVRLFSDIQGDLFSIQGLPLLPVLDVLLARGDIPG